MAHSEYIYMNLNRIDNAKSVLLDCLFRATQYLHDIEIDYYLLNLASTIFKIVTSTCYLSASCSKQAEWGGGCRHG